MPAFVFVLERPVRNSLLLTSFIFFTCFCLGVGPCHHFFAHNTHTPTHQGYYHQHVYPCNQYDIIRDGDQGIFPYNYGLLPGDGVLNYDVLLILICVINLEKGYFTSYIDILRFFKTFFFILVEKTKNC